MVIFCRDVSLPEATHDDHRGVWAAQVVSLLGVTGTRETEQADAKANRLKECQAPGARVLWCLSCGINHWL